MGGAHSGHNRRHRHLAQSVYYPSDDAYTGTPYPAHTGAIYGVMDSDQYIPYEPPMQQQYDGNNTQQQYNANMQQQYDPSMQQQYDPNMQQQYDPNMQYDPMQQNIYGAYPMRRANSDPTMMDYDPGMQFGGFQGTGNNSYDWQGQNMQNMMHAYYGYYQQQLQAQQLQQVQHQLQHQQQQQRRRPPPARSGSLPNLHDAIYGRVGHQMPHPFMHYNRMFGYGYNTSARRRDILRRLDMKQQDPFQKTAEWLLKSDQRRMR